MSDVEDDMSDVEDDMSDFEDDADADQIQEIFS